MSLKRWQPPTKLQGIKQNTSHRSQHSGNYIYHLFNTNTICTLPTVLTSSECKSYIGWSW